MPSLVIKFTLFLDPRLIQTTRRGQILGHGRQGGGGGGCRWGSGSGGNLGSLANGSCGPSRCGQSRDGNSVGHVLILNGTALGDGRQCDRVNSAAYGIMMKPARPPWPAPPLLPPPPPPPSALAPPPAGTAFSRIWNFGCRHIQYNLCIHITWKGASPQESAKVVARIRRIVASKPLTHKAPVALERNSCCPFFTFGISVYLLDLRWHWGRPIIQSPRHFAFSSCSCSCHTPSVESCELHNCTWSSFRCCLLFTVYCLLLLYS